MVVGGEFGIRLVEGKLVDRLQVTEGVRGDFLVENGEWVLIVRVMCV